MWSSGGTDVIMGVKNKRALRLQAADAEDFKVIAACLQDSVVRLSEMTFQSDEKQFIVVLDRFVWEGFTATQEIPETLFQVQSGLRFNGITSVRAQGIDQASRGEVLELLTVAFEPGVVTLVFSGSAALKLEGEAIVCYLEDLAVPRPCGSPPRHAVG